MPNAKYWKDVLSSKQMSKFGTEIWFSEAYDAEFTMFMFLSVGRSINGINNKQFIKMRSRI